MPTDLVASATKLFTPELLSRFASALGIDGAMLEKAVSAGIPGLLAAFTSLVGKPGGAEKLSDAIAQQQPSPVASIANALGGPGQQELVDTGFGTLSSLLGGNVLSTLTSAVSKYVGLSEAQTKRLVGCLGPMLMGLLGEQQRASGLGLARLLESQKGNIARAMPEGFADNLSGSGLLDAVAGSTVRDWAGATPRHASSQGSWVLPVLGLVALGAIAWYLFAAPRTQTVATLPEPQSSAQMQSPGSTTFIVTADEANDWIGRPVYSSDNKIVGQVLEITRDRGNKVVDVYIDAGAALGLGATHYHVKSDQIRDMKPDGLLLTLTESEADAMSQLPNKQGQ